MTLLELMAVFFYVGLFTIGGGQVAITLMYEPVVGKELITAEEFYNMVAVSESTPGPIGINMATYIGYSQYGVLGGIATTAATVLPSLIIILVIAAFFDRYQDKPLVKTVFSVIRPVSAGLVAVAAWNVLTISLVNPAVFSVLRLALFLGSLALFLLTKLSPIVILLLGAAFGVAFL